MFRKEYAAESPVLSQSKKSSNYVFCNVCKCDFSIAHGGRKDCLKHAESARHQVLLTPPVKTLQAYFQVLPNEKAK